MKYQVIVEYEYPVDHKTPVKAELILHGDKVVTNDVAPVIHAKWKDGICTNCHCDVPAYIIDWKWTKDMDAKYCPNCGAKMDKE